MTCSEPTQPHVIGIKRSQNRQQNGRTQSELASTIKIVKIMRNNQ